MKGACTCILLCKRLSSKTFVRKFWHFVLCAMLAPSIAGKTCPYEILATEISVKYVWNPLFVNRNYAILQPKKFIIFNLRLLVDNFDLNKNICCETFSELLVLILYNLKGTEA